MVLYKRVIMTTSQKFMLDSERIKNKKEGVLKLLINEYNNNNGHTVYYENEDGYWYKQLFDIHDNLIYFEDSNGHIDDYRYEEGN